VNALTNEKEMRNPNFGEIVKHLEIFFIIWVLENGTKMDCRCDVAFAVLAAAVFRVVKHGLKNGVNLEFGTVVFECVFLFIGSNCVDECCCPYCTSRVGPVLMSSTASWKASSRVEITEDKEANEEVGDKELREELVRCACGTFQRKCWSNESRRSSSTNITCYYFSDSVTLWP